MRRPVSLHRRSTIAGRGARPARRAGWTAALSLLLSASGAAGGPLFEELTPVGVGLGDKGELGFAEPRAIAVSSDGLHLYVGFTESGGNVGAVLHARRYPGSGRLYSRGEEYRCGAGSSPASDLALSPDGAHLYIAITGYGARVAVRARDAATGELASTGSQVNPPDVGGLAVSPDGAHVFVSTDNHNSLEVYDRDGVSGDLTLLQTLQDGVSGVDGLAGARDIAVSADGKFVYVASRWDDAVAVFGRDLGTGLLTFVEAQFDNAGGGPALDAPVNLTLSPDGAHLYVVSGENSITAFSRNPVTGALTFVDAEVDGVGGVDGLYYPQVAAISNDGDHVYVSGYSDGLLARFDRNPGTGALTFAGTVDVGTQPLVFDKPFAVAVSPDDAWVYVGVFSDGFHQDKVLAFQRDAGSGDLTFDHARADQEWGFNATRAVAMSTDGAYVYSASAAPGAVASFSRDGMSGAIAPVEVEYEGVAGVTGLDGATALAVSPDGQHLYVASEIDDAVVGFSLDSGGALTFVGSLTDGIGGVDGLDGAHAVTVSPDGNHVYVASKDDDSVAVFSRTPATGVLTYASRVTDGVSGVDGLDGADAVVVSSDGAHVYAAGRDDDAIAIFSRNPGTGALTWSSVLRDDDLDGISALSISPDGKHLYAAAETAAKLVVYARQTPSGLLTLVETHAMFRGGAIGLDAPTFIFVAPDGRHVYAGSTERQSPFFALDIAVASFRRDPVTGRLAYVQPLNEIFGATAAVTSPDGRDLYVADAFLDRIVRSTQVPVCPDTPPTGCFTGAASKLLVRNRIPVTTKDTVVYRARGGDPGPSFSDPRFESSYAFCLYHSPGGTPALITDLAAPIGGLCGRSGSVECWDQVGQSYFYLDTARNPDGLVRMTLRQNPALIGARLAGAQLRDFPEVQLEVPVTAAVVNSSGQCWSTEFTAPDVTINQFLPGTRTLFNARKD